MFRYTTTAAGGVGAVMVMGAGTGFENHEVVVMSRGLMLLRVTRRVCETSVDR